MGPIVRAKQWREVAIIVAVSVAIEAVILLVAADPVWRRNRGDREGTQKALVKKFVFEGYVEWAIHHPRIECPPSLQVVADEMGRKDTLDAWGRELVMFCGDDLPAGAKKDTFGVMSLGRDGIAGTADDIRSWD